jgi:hypothetical protein
MKNKKKFEAEACEFKNETECEEDIEEESSDVKKAEDEFFEEDDSEADK